MPDTAIHPIPKQGKFRRALAAVGAWLQGLDYTGFDYTLDRIEGLEQELARLKEELRQSREASSRDAYPGGAVKLEH
jgi:HAMP domain-containing protein